jgi:hypothetical protein
VVSSDHEVVNSRRERAGAFVIGAAEFRAKLHDTVVHLGRPLAFKELDRGEARGHVKRSKDKGGNPSQAAEVTT